MRLDTSYHQKRIWFLEKFESDNLVKTGTNYYNLSVLLKLSGSLDIELLKKSFNEIIKRHEALRTRIISFNDGPVQLIDENIDFQLNVIEDGISSYNEAILVARDKCNESFSLEKDLLLRANLIKVNQAEYLLSVCVHNAVSDRHSLLILIEELFHVYVSLINNSEPGLPDLPIQYADFAQWQNEISGDLHDSLLFFWKRQLPEQAEPLEFPTDYSRDAILKYDSKSYRFRIPELLTQRVNDFCHLNGLNVNTFLFAAFKILIYKYTSEDQLIIGNVLKNRRQIDVENIVGPVENILPVKSDSFSSKTVLDFLRTLSKRIDDVNENQDLPFDRLITDLHPEKNLSRNPLFDIVFTFSEDQLKIPSITDLSAEVMEMNSCVGKYDLNLLVSFDSKSFSAVLNYNSNLFNDASIEQIAKHYCAVIERILENPGMIIKDLNILTKNEEEKMLYEWNNTHSEYPDQATLHQLFSEQADKYKDNVAVSFRDKSINYEELNFNSDKLANFFRSRCKVKRNDLICVMLDKSGFMITTLLAILKAGGAYVPVDPDYPSERINYILDNCRSNLIITSAEHRSKVSKEFNGIILEEDDIEMQFKNSETVDVKNINEPDDIAYIIYTSGTTGNPKGCMVTHRNVVRLMINNRTPYDFSEKDVWIMAHSFCFDFSVWEMYGALLYGGKLIVPDKDEVRDVNSFLSILKKNKVTVLNQTPLAFYNLIAEERNSPDKNLDSHLRYVIFGGDKLEPQKLKHWADMYGLKKIQLINMYGITETTVHVTFYRLQDSDINSNVSLSPIGKPIPGTTVYVFDEGLKLVPRGVKGEFYVGGTGVSKGYLFKEELTSERFIKNPYNADEIIYKTGDEGFWHADGTLEYIGRKDNQVKIRGYRIELGEIENSIRNFGSIKDLVVLVREEKSDDKRLIAYIVFDKSSSSTTELRQFLKDKLPEHMVPASFIVLKEIPITSNGKIDRKALLAIDLKREDLDSSYVSPQTPVEETLAKIWKEVINIDKVGVHDNFFELGGDSIMSIQIISRASLAGLKITPKQIFQYQTIAELSSVIGGSKTETTDQQIITGPIPLSPIQHWFFRQNLRNPEHYNHSVLLKVPYGLNEQFLKESVSKILQHHDAIRLSFKKNSTWEQYNEDIQNHIPFEVLNLVNVSKEHLDDEITKVINELQTGFDLSKGPLINVRLIKSGSNEPDRLLIIIHHLSVDGISWRIILDDLYNCYTQLTHNGKIELPDKTSSFKAWNEFLTVYANDEKIDPEKNYWISVSEEDIKSIPVDTEIVPDKNTVESLDTVSITFEEETTQQLLLDVPKAYNTKINDVLLTSLIMAYNNFAKENKMKISLEGHGRVELFESADLSRTVGWFTTIFPVTLKVENSDDIGESIKHIKEHLRKIPNEGIGYGVLRYMSNNENLKQKLEASPDPQILFNYLGQFNDVISASGNNGSDSSWRFGKSSLILHQNEKESRRYLLEIDCMIIRNRLLMNFNYSRNIHKRETINLFADLYKEALQNIIDHCKSPDAGGFTPSDFSVSGLNQQELDNLLANLK